MAGGVEKGTEPWNSVGYTVYERPKKTGLEVIVIKLAILVEIKKTRDYNCVESNVPFLRVRLVTIQTICFVVSEINLNTSFQCKTILPLPLTKMHVAIEHIAVGNFNRIFSVLRSQ